MLLPQIVGMTCVVCKKGIGSIVEGTYCEHCGNPLHARCVGKVHAPPTERCDACGGDPDSPSAKQVRGAWAVLDLAEETGALESFPLGSACPNCGSTDCSYERPKRWIAFAWDRICRECGMRYTPPTPLWAAFVFLIVGLVLSIIGVVGLVAGDVCVGLLGVLGILALLHGIRILRRPGQV